MERFLRIDWNPHLEDIIDDKFVNEEILETESVMHRIMTGNFVDPFKDMDDDYKNIKLDLLKSMQSESDEEYENDPDHTNKTVVPVEKTKRSKCYIPGITKPTFKFPRLSKLKKEQQAMCLRVLLRFSESNQPKINATERDELNTYMSLQPIISQEQEEYLEFAKSKWTSRQLKLTCEDYINLRWKSKLKYIQKLPRYHTEVTNVPFVANKNIAVKFISTCLQMGCLPRVTLPRLTSKCVLRINCGQLEESFPPTNYACEKSPKFFKLPVSEDPNCQKLAEDNDVDLVISSSGLNCLVNNIGPNYQNSWILPVVIKAHNGKNIVYIDKPAPPIASTIPQKNTWVYKYILRHFFVHANCRTSKTDEIYNNNMFGDVNSDELLKLEDEYENTLTNARAEVDSKASRADNTGEDVTEGISEDAGNQYSTENVVDDCEKNSYIIPITSDTNKIDIEDKEETITDKHMVLDTETEDKKIETEENQINESLAENAQLSEDNVSYNLFSIGPDSSEQNELMKNSVTREYKLLVRTKTDGFEVSEDEKEHCMLILSPKLEYQIDLGAEAVTLEEALKQWISLTFRPLTFLARVRIAAETSEILQIERRTTMSVSNEIKRLHNVKVEDSLTVLHNIAQSLENLSPGRYIMRHTIRNGAFATVFKEAQDPGKNVFDLHTVYGEIFHTLPNPAWPPIDKIVPTPMQKHFEIMPAMFKPPINVMSQKKGPVTKGCKSNTAAVRRSLRNKKKND